MSNAMTDYQIDEDRNRARAISSDMALGVKHPPGDLNWYRNYLVEDFHSTWRHKESGSIYNFSGIGFAATGNGTLAVMVHYTPHGASGPLFERQLEPFREKFEPVRSAVVWEPA